MTQHSDATFHPCSFGGGWLTANTAEGREWLEAYFNDVPAFLPPLGEEGWIVEPADVPSVAEAAVGKITVTVE